MTKGDFFVICAGRGWCAIVRVLGNAAIPDEKFPWGTESEDGYPLSNLSPWVSEGGGRKMRRALVIDNPRVHLVIPATHAIIRIGDCATAYISAALFFFCLR